MRTSDPSVAHPSGIRKFIGLGLVLVGRVANVFLFCVMGTMSSSSPLEELDQDEKLEVESFLLSALDVALGILFLVFEAGIDLLTLLLFVTFRFGRVGCGGRFRVCLPSKNCLSDMYLVVLRRGLQDIVSFVIVSWR